MGAEVLFDLGCREMYRVGVWPSGWKVVVVGSVPVATGLKRVEFVLEGPSGEVSRKWFSIDLANPVFSGRIADVVEFFKGLACSVIPPAESAYATWRGRRVRMVDPAYPESYPERRAD